MKKVGDYRNQMAADSAMEEMKHTRNSQHWSVLEAWIRELGLEDGTGAEIGVMRGWNTSHQLNAFPNLTMIMVDQWKVIPDTGVAGWDNLAHLDMDYTAWRVKRRAESYKGRATVIHADSVAGAEQVPDDSLDFIFIDADHTVEGCSRDIRAWAPKVKKTGWIMGHDCDRAEVIEALDKLLPGWKMAPPSRIEDKCWRIAKRKVKF